MDWDNPKPTFHPSHNNLRALNSKSCSSLSCRSAKSEGDESSAIYHFGSAKKPQDECSALRASRKFRSVPSSPNFISNIYIYIYVHAAAWRLGTVNNYDHEYLITGAFSNLLPDPGKKEQGNKKNPSASSYLLLYAWAIGAEGICLKTSPVASVGWWESGDRKIEGSQNNKVELDEGPSAGKWTRLPGKLNLTNAGARHLSHLA